jgi:membrane-associated phospholipid phosphatase
MRRALTVLAVPAALAVVVLGVLFAGEHTGAAVDRALAPWLASSTAANWSLAEAIDFAGEPAGLAVLVAVLAGTAWLLGRRRVAALVVLGTGLSITATSAIKPLAGRTIHEVYLSYPSGHTASATALAMIAVMLCWHRLGPVTAFALLLLAALVAGAAAAWAQAGLVAHYPTDTLGGWCTALAVVPATARLIDRTATWHQSRRDATTRA